MKTVFPYAVLVQRALEWQPPSQVLADAIAQGEALALEITGVKDLGASAKIQRSERCDPTNWNVAALTELRPPPEHEGKPLHWLVAPLGRTGNHAGMLFVAEWELCGNWIMPKWRTMTSDEAAVEGYRYLGPAEWKPTRDDASTAGEAWRQQAVARIAELTERYDTFVALAADAAATKDGMIADLETLLLAERGTNERLRQEYFKLEKTGARCGFESDDPAPAPPPDSGVHADIERTIDHLLNGRTTKDQRKGLSTAAERAERVRPGDDAAVGRALR